MLAAVLILVFRMDNHIIPERNIPLTVESLTPESLPEPVELGVMLTAVVTVALMTTAEREKRSSAEMSVDRT
ncbi:hypothetical protein M5689_008304 [Euphorbia peplus]|nr:hypothetical protein M5689_008304 [Euphorbia peplus]